MKEAIVKSEPIAALLAREQDRVALIVAGVRTNLPSNSSDTINVLVSGERKHIPVVLGGLYHNVEIRSETNRWSPMGYFELQITSKPPGLFEWSSWHRDPPGRFQLLTDESGVSYACATLRGIQLWRLSESRPSEAMRITYNKPAPHPDALPLLDGTLIAEAVGRTNLIWGTLLSSIIVESLSQSGDTFYVTLHGLRAKPRVTFELRNGKWVRTGLLHNDDYPPPAH